MIPVELKKQAKLKLKIQFDNQGSKVCDVSVKDHTYLNLIIINLESTDSEAGFDGSLVHIDCLMRLLGRNLDSEQDFQIGLITLQPLSLSRDIKDYWLSSKERES